MLLQQLWEQKVDWDDPVRNLSEMSGYNGALNYTSSQVSTFLDATSTRNFKSPHCNCMDSVMPPSVPMLQSSILE